MADQPLTTIEENLPHWDDYPEVYDSVFLAGQLLPGVAKIKVSRKRKIDKKSAKGKDKATVTVQGYDAAEVTITLQLLDRADALALKALMPLLEPEADKAKRSDADALDIASYATSYRGIQAIIIEDLEGPELVDGILNLSIKAVEFHKKPAATKGTGVGGGAGVKIGFFTDQLGQPIPGSYVAIQGPAYQDGGKPKLDPDGKAIFVWQQLAVSGFSQGDDSAKGFSEVTGSFLGSFLSEDGLLRLNWENAQGTKAKSKDKDVTATPDKAKGGPSLADFGGTDNDAPKPIDIDGEP